MSAIRPLLLVSSVVLQGCDVVLGIDGPIETRDPSAASSVGPGGGGTGSGGGGAGGACALPSEGSWEKRFGDFEAQRATAVATGMACEVVVAGTFDGILPTDAGNPSNVGPPDMFVMKLDAAGAGVWTLQLGGTGPSGRIDAVAIGPEGDITLAGQLFGPVDFGDGDSIGPMGSDTDGFVVRYDADRSLRWKRHIGGAGDDVAAEVALDASGDCVVVGTTFEPATLLEETVAALGAEDAFVAMLANDDGATRWVKLLGGNLVDTGTSVAVRDAQVLAAFDFEGTVDLGDGRSTVGVGRDAAFLALNVENGGFVAGRVLGGSGGHSKGSIAALPGGEQIAVGITMKSADLSFAGHAYHAGSSDHRFVAWVNADFNPLGPGRIVGDTTQIYDVHASAQVAPDGTLMIVGSFAGSVSLDLGGENLDLSPGAPFVAAFDPELGHLHSEIWAGAALSAPGLSLAIDPSGAPVVVGAFSDTLLELRSAGTDDAFVVRRPSVVP